MTDERKNEILNLMIDWLDYHDLPDLVDELMSERYELDTALSDGVTFIDDHIHDKEDKELAWKEVIGLTDGEMNELHISDMYDYLNESEDESEEVRFSRALNKFLSDTNSKKAPSGDKSLDGGWFSIPIIFKDNTEGKFYWTGRTPNERVDVTIHKKDINSYGTDLETLIRRVNKILDKNISINKASLEDISLNDIRNKALNLGYEVIDDERDSDNTIIIYKVESKEGDNFDDFDNEALYKYLAKLPSVEAQIDDEDPSCLVVWLKDTIDEKKELIEDVRDKSDLQSDLEDIFNTLGELRNRLATHEAEEVIDKIYDVLGNEINNGVFVDCDTDDLIG